MINKRQYIILSFFLTRALFLGGCFSLLVKLTKNSMLIAGGIGILVGYFLLYLLYKMKSTVSSVVKVLICVFILLINTLSSNMLTSNYLLSNTPTFFILFLFFVVLLYGNSKKTEIIARVSEVVILFSFLIYVLGYIGISTNIDFTKLFPIMNSNFTNVMKGIIIFSAASLLPNILLLDYKDKLKFKDISIGYIIGCISILLIMFFILTIYGSELSSIARFPEYLILKKINIMNYITNLENVLVMEWIVNIIICCLFSIKVLSSCLKDIKLLFYLVIITLFAGCELFLFRNYSYVLFIKNYIYYGCFILVIFSLFFRKRKTTD